MQQPQEHLTLQQKKTVKNKENGCWADLHGRAMGKSSCNVPGTSIRSRSGKYECPAQRGPCRLTVVSSSFSFSRAKDQGAEEKGLFWERVPQLTPLCSPHSCTRAMSVDGGDGCLSSLQRFSWDAFHAPVPSQENLMSSQLWATEDSKHTSSKGQCL